MPVPARGLTWVAQPFSFHMLPASPEAGDRPEAPGGHARKAGRGQSSARKSGLALTSGQRKEPRTGRESAGPHVPSPFWDPDPLWVTGRRQSVEGSSCFNLACPNLFSPCRRLPFHSEASCNCCEPKCLRQPCPGKDCPNERVHLKPKRVREHRMEVTLLGSQSGAGAGSLAWKPSRRLTTYQHMKTIF